MSALPCNKLRHVCDTPCCLQAFVMHSLHRELQTRLGKEQNVFAGESTPAQNWQQQ